MKDITEKQSILQLGLLSISLVKSSHQFSFQVHTTKNLFVLNFTPWESPATFCNPTEIHLQLIIKEFDNNNNYFFQ